MDREGEGGLFAWLIDVAAAGLLAAACAYAGTRLGSPVIGVGGGSAAMLLALIGLRLVTPERRRFRLPALAHQPEFQVAPDVPKPVEPEALILDDVLDAVGPDSRVVRLFAQTPLPTAGELVQRIRIHQGGLQDHAEPHSQPVAQVIPLPVDASAALREALADLRRSLA